MRIGVPKEMKPGQMLVGLSPDTVKKLMKLGYEICIETDAGVSARFFDDQYQDAGASVVSREEVFSSDIIICLDTPPMADLESMHAGQTLICRMNPGANPQLVEKVSSLGITALAMDMVPRISRAQALDVRSSLANVGGYRAVVEAANAFGRTFAPQVTAAGKVPPAKIYVIGVGVAGLAAIGCGASMGAVVSATDVRPEVADQVESLGGTFVEIPVKQESSDGYAKALDDEQQKITLEVYKQQAAKNDIVITTAQVPGRPAPLLLTAEAVAGMKPGSVVVDMGASPLGGNCELSKPDEVVVTENGVTIIGYTDLPSRLPSQGSQLFGQNMVNFFKLTTPGKDGNQVLDMDDEVVRGVTVSLNGEGMWPPPAVKVSAAPTKPKEEAPAEAEEKKEKKKLNPLAWILPCAALAAALVWFAPSDMKGHFVIFELAVVIGFYVITNVTHSLHTPLMSVTNAISGIIIVGAALLIGSSNPIIVALSFVAMLVASINIFGGFLVTRRMLGMFQRSSEK